MKRLRPVYSCLPCRKRRLRCDKEHPSCGRCAAGGTQCKYDESPNSMPERREEGEMSSSSGHQSIERGKAPEGHHRTDKGYLSVSRGGRSSYKGATFWGNAIPSEILQEDDYSHDTPPADPIPFNTWPVGRNIDDRWCNGYFRPPRPGHVPLSEIPSKQCRYCGRAYRLSCIQYLLPNRSICEKLCDVFFATVFPLMPILHFADFVHDFRIFWREVGDRRHHDMESVSIIRVKPAFLCLLSAILFAVLSSASPAHIEGILGESAALSSADMYFAVMTCATLTGFPRSPTLYSLAAYLIVHSQFIREEEIIDSPNFIGTAFRLALGMGLHRHLPEAGFTPAELETRRRLWWYIMHLDVMASASSGISPLFIDDKMANTDMIMPYDETEDEDGKKVRTTDVRYLVAMKRYKVTKEIRVILRCHFDDSFELPNILSDTLQRLTEITNEINQTTESLLNWSSSQLSSSSSGAEPGGFDRVWRLDLDTDDKEVRDFTSWSVLLLHMMIHKAYCILYHPFFRNDASTLAVSVRANAVKHAQAFLQLFIRVCNDTISEPFHWMYPGTYQPFQALSLLLADMLQHPHSDDATLSRGIVDAVFDLYRVDEGMVSHIRPPSRQLSSSGRNVWSMLARTRRRALDIIGEDHHVLLPSEMISADNCVCGERIAGSKHASSQSTPREQSAHPHIQDNAFLAPTSAAFLDDAFIMSQAQLPIPNGFDWEEFEASIAPETGFIS